MAITRSETQVTWAAATSKSVAAGGNAESDAFTVDATCFQAQIEVKADNEGTPAAGDIVAFYLHLTLGDPDGAAASEYGTGTQDVALGSLNTNADDPAVMTKRLPLPVLGGKVYAVSSASSNAITVSATILEQRG